MYNYLAFLYGGITTPGNSPLEDGERLARQCVDKLKGVDNPEQFPPKLLILIVSPEYLEQESALQLVTGVHSSFAAAGFGEVPLIGSSAAAVFFDRKIHPRGALLVCLASRLIDAKPAVGPNVSLDEQAAVDALFEELDIETAISEYPKLLPNRTLLTFFPGSGRAGPAARHSTDNLHKMLWERLTYRIPIVGGVSSANDPDRKRSGIQFVGCRVYTDALAACLIFSGVPPATSMARGLKRTGTFLRVSNLSDDGQTIDEFEEGNLADILSGEKGPVLLREQSSVGDVLMAVSLPKTGYQVVRALRNVKEKTVLEITKPDPEALSQSARDAVDLSLRRIGVENPVGCFAIKCTGQYRFRNVTGLYIEAEISKFEERKNGVPYVGGFFDGEAGASENGSSECGNWGVAAVVFGDEMSDRALVQRVFSTISEHGIELASNYDLDKAISISLYLIRDIGFPGAMISLVMTDSDGEFIVPRKAGGARLKRMFGSKPVSLSGDDLIAGVVRKKENIFVRDSRDMPGDKDLISKSGIISQYIVPLCDSEGRVFAVLQVDLGDMRYRGKRGLLEVEKKVLDSAGAMVGASLNRVFSSAESQIVRKLDNALKASLSATTLDEGLQQFLEVALDAFNLQMGHVRVADSEKQSLVMRAGIGGYHETAKDVRSEVPYADGAWSPTCRAFNDGNIIIINDTLYNAKHQRMVIRSVEQTPLMSDAWKGVSSYANVPFKSEEGQAKGTISLVSDRPWFFAAYHHRALAALGRRLAFLVENLSRKQNEEEARNLERRARKRLQFLLDASPNLHQITNFDNTEKVLGEAISNFCNSIEAERAALYLWDDLQNQYILKAQYGWKSPQWINAARYTKEDVWIGAIGVKDRPKYVRDLHQYYKESGCGNPVGRYARHIFGKDLSDEFSVEAIALPLRVEADELGILTLYRPITSISEHIWDFVAEDTNLLQEGANYISGLVKLVLWNQQSVIDSQEEKRRSEIYKAITQKDEKETFEAKVCKKAIEELGAVRADFYKVIEDDSKYIPYWKAGFQKDKRRYETPIETSILPGHLSPSLSIQASTDEKMVKADPESPDSHLDRVIELEGQEVEICPQKLTVEEKKYPEIAITEGRLKRACVPLLSANKLLGVLDLRWEIDGQSRSLPMTLHNKVHLQTLGQMIGTVYQRHQIETERRQAEREAEKGRIAVQAVGAMVFQAAHRLSNLIQALYGLSLRSKESENREKQRELIDRLLEETETAKQRIAWPMDVGQQVQQLSVEDCNLRELVKRVLNKEIDNRGKALTPKLYILENLAVKVNPILIEQALTNLINNAARAMESKDNPLLSIGASSTDDRKGVRIVIEDNGKGMTKEEIKAALTGFVGTQTHRGVGVLISRVLIEVHGGSLEFESVPGAGTRAIVFLPKEQMEDDQ